MGVLRLTNMDDSVVNQYTNSSAEDQNRIKQILQYWLNKDAQGIQLLVEQLLQPDQKSLLEEALRYADHHPVFPLNWSQNKLSREEMNAR